MLKEHLGQLPLAALENAHEINRFNTDSDWAEDVEIASVHRVLERLWTFHDAVDVFLRTYVDQDLMRSGDNAVCRDRILTLENIRIAAAI